MSVLGRLTQAALQDAAVGFVRPGCRSGQIVRPDHVGFPAAQSRKLPASKVQLNRCVTVKAASVAAVDTYTEVRDDDDEYYEVPVHTVTVHDRQRGITHTFQVPEDQYILHTGEEEGIELPFACRHGCCTACAVRIKSGNILQPGALGISPELKQQGYALMCVGIPQSDLEVETQDEDEVYWLQFGRYFARGPVERDDYALELALQDE